MKTVKILVALALVAGGTLKAVTVGFTGTTVTPNPTTTATGPSATPAVAQVAYDSISFGSGAITARGFFWNDAPNPDIWATEKVRYNGVGVGVARAPADNRVNGYLYEYLLLDFGSSVEISSLGLHYANNSIDDPTVLRFTYAWVSGPPQAGTQLPVAAPLTSVTGTPSGSIPGVLTFTSPFGATSGRYLLLGASDHSTLNSGDPFNSSFSVNTVTYTQVPDGASTIVLLGAAVGALGFATRRRRL